MLAYLFYADEIVSVHFEKLELQTRSLDNDSFEIKDNVLKVYSVDNHYLYKDIEKKVVLSVAILG